MALSNQLGKGQKIGKNVEFRAFKNQPDQFVVVKKNKISAFKKSSKCLTPHHYKNKDDNLLTWWHCNRNPAQDWKVTFIPRKFKSGVRASSVLRSNKEIEAAKKRRVERLRQKRLALRRAARLRALKLRRLRLRRAAALKRRAILARRRALNLKGRARRLALSRARAMRQRALRMSRSRSQRIRARAARLRRIR